MAVSFDGTADDQWHDTACTTTLNLHTSSGFTMMAWVKLNTFNLNQPNAVAQVWQLYNGQSSLIQYIRDASGYLEFWKAAAYRAGDYTMEIGDSNWHHVVWRMGAGNRDGDCEWARWLDGTKTVMDAAFAGGLGTSADVNSSSVAGHAFGTDGYECDCCIEELAAWDYPLTDAQIEFMAKGYSYKFLKNDPPGIHMSFSQTDASIPFTPEGAQKGTLIYDESGTGWTGSSHVGGPGLIYPSAQIIPFPSAAAPPAGSYTIYNNYYRQLLAGNV